MDSSSIFESIDCIGLHVEFFVALETYQRQRRRDKQTIVDREILGFWYFLLKGILDKQSLKLRQGKIRLVYVDTKDQKIS